MRSSGSSEERFAVAVDFVDLHGRDYLTELTEDDVFRLLRDRLLGHAEEANRRVLHEFGRRADRDREDARHVDADILHRERAAERNFDLHRLEAQERVILKERNDKFRAAVNAERGRFARRPAENHHDFVARASLIARAEENERPKYDESGENCRYGKKTGRVRAEERGER